MEQACELNLASTIELIVEILELSDVSAREAKDLKEQFDVIVLQTFVVLLCILSIRGSEGAMLNLPAALKCKDVSNN